MAIEFIYTDNNFKELGYLKDATLDIEIGKYGISTNDFEITLSTNIRDLEFDDGSLFYCEGTEWGGLLENKKVNTDSKKITYMGHSFRGLLEKEYVQPSDGEAYLKLKGDANDCIRELIGNRFGNLYVVDNLGISGIEVNYQVRDLNLLEAIEKTLKTANARLDIQFINSRVHLQAVLIQDLSDTIRYDNDYQVQMEVTTKEKPYNHILALGQGELTERLRLNLYLQEDGSWGNNEYYSEFEKKTYKYENVNVADEEELMIEAIDKVESLNTTDKLEISFDADDANLFDIVGAKEQITGIEFKEQITQKILKGTIGNLSVSYKVGE